MPSKWLYHTYQTESEPILYIQLDDHVFRIPPNEPFEVDKDSNGRTLETPEFYAHHILQQHGGIYGIVEIESTRTRTGIQLNVEKAEEMAKAALILNRHRHINLWAQEQLKTRVNKNLPVMAPTGFVADSIKVLNVDLDAVYRIKPVGWDFRPSAQSAADPALLGPPVGVERDERIAGLEAQVEMLSAGMQQLLANQRSDSSPSPTANPPKPPSPPKPPAARS